MAIRVHADLHLGQTLLSDRGWTILDFEGEPARPLPERRAKHSPLRDVAGLLRSLAYAPLAARLQRDADPPDDWEPRAREAFLDGYLDAIDPTLLPATKREVDQLLAIYELEKAVYELNYELGHRPDWVGIPVAGITRLLEVEVHERRRPSRAPDPSRTPRPAQGSRRARRTARIVIRAYRPAAEKVVARDDSGEASS